MQNKVKFNVQPVAATEGHPAELAVEVSGLNRKQFQKVLALVRSDQFTGTDPIGWGEEEDRSFSVRFSKADDVTIFLNNLVGMGMDIENKTEARMVIADAAERMYAGRRTAG